MSNSSEESRWRLALLRVIYGGTFLFVGTNAWKEILTHDGSWDPLHAVAFSFWAAYATLMFLGLLHPLKMLPLVLLQLFYKLIWLIAVGWPSWAAGSAAGGLAPIFIIAVVVDLLVIPWPYVLRTYVLRAS